jgi:hypothetical protein
MNWRFTASVIVIFMMLFLLGWLVHDVLLRADYDRIRQLMRPPDEVRGRILYIFLAQLCTAAAFVWMYRRGREDRHWLGQGLRYAMAVALLATVPINLVQYAAMPFPLDFTLKRMCYDVASVALLGVVVAWINRGMPGRHG